MCITRVKRGVKEKKNQRNTFKFKLKLCAFTSDLPVGKSRNPHFSYFYKALMLICHEGLWRRVQSDFASLHITQSEMFHYVNAEINSICSRHVINRLFKLIHQQSLGVQPRIFLKEISIEQKRILTVFKVTLKVPLATASFKSPIAIRGSNGRFPPATTPEWKRLSPKYLLFLIKI